MITTDKYALYNGDCVEVIKQLPNDCIGLTITSVPFANLYTYSDDPRDFSNVEDLDQFFNQMDYLIPELYRVTQPGRLIALHCKQIPTFKGRDGEMGLIDFRGQLISAFKKHGWSYHGEVTIWTDPQLEATRTKAASILYKTFRTAAEKTRTGMPDYVVIMQKQEREDEWQHVIHEHTTESFEEWTKLASPCWGISDKTPSISRTNVLNTQIAKDDKDEKHMTPLQLDTIRWLIEWYSNKDDVILDPFNGVGSTCYQAVKMNRKAVGIELKESYYKKSIDFLKEAANDSFSHTLFDFIEGSNN